jgi:hypothetical protein
MVTPVRDQDTETSRWSQSTVGGSQYPPPEDYAFISDCEGRALIAPNGNVVRTVTAGWDG